MAYGKKKNMAGVMGALSSQPLQNMRFSMNFNPLERLNQRMAGKSQGRSMAGVKKKKQSLLGKA
tara:strand:+ start:53 stop:244 length:192 start_codon:yes stop_codon:yes gene_type:complete